MPIGLPIGISAMGESFTFRGRIEVPKWIIALACAFLSVGSSDGDDGNRGCLGVGHGGCSERRDRERTQDRKRER